MRQTINIEKRFIKLLSVIIVLTILTTIIGSCASKEDTSKKKDTPLNILLLTLDDMNYGHTGVEGCSVPDITPNIDKLASEGMLFTHGYVMSPKCGPSRNAILSGRYPHCNGMMGHGKQPPPNWQQPEIVTPTISKYLHDLGYTTGAILKNRRHKQFNVWDVAYQDLSFGTGYHDRNPESFYERTKAFIASAAKQKKPFFLYANPIDPHRPWPDTDQEKEYLARWNPDKPYPEPSRRYNANEVEVPNFLPDLPDIRKNLIPYYESLHRGDECIGGILKALEESGMEDNTLVVFLSDHGMAVIGAKGTLYYDGIRTPIILKWPDKIKEGVVDDESIVSSIDLVPTILDAIGLPGIEGIEGKSFYDVIIGKSKISNRKYAYCAYNYFLDSTPKEFLPSRGIIDKEFCYIWNSYMIRSDGKQIFRRYWMDVVQSSLNIENISFSKKINSIIYKDIEELFDLTNDPGCWNNLADSTEYSDVLSKYRNRLLNEMKLTADPELPIFTFN